MFEVEGDNSVTHGGLRFTVLKVEKFPQIVNLAGYEYEAKSSWLVVTLHVENAGDGVPTYKSKDQTMVSDGIAYRAESNMRGVDDSQWVSSEIASIPLFFDVPEDFPENQTLILLNLAENDNDTAPAVVSIRASRQATEMISVVATEPTTTTTAVRPTTTAVAMLTPDMTQPPTTTTIQPPTTTTTTTTTIPGLGQPVRDGNFEFIIHRIFRPDPASIRGEPLGAWLAVDMTVKNIKTRLDTFFATDQLLIVDDAEYEPGYSSIPMIDINPGLQVDVTVIYDVPPSVFNSQSLVLELHDSFLSGGVDVEIRASDL